MQKPLQLTFRSTPHSDALATHVNRRAEKLDHIFDRILWCHVVVEPADDHRSRGEPYRITVKLGLPGHEILASQSPSEGRFLDDVRETADRAFDDVERELEDWVKSQGEQREQEAPHA
jgi:ribosome-associated translation inhibitor RaiA